MPRDDDWEDEVRADQHERELRHGEIHRDGRGVWVDNWFYPLGVMTDVLEHKRGVVAGENGHSAPTDECPEQS